MDNSLIGWATNILMTAGYQTAANTPLLIQDKPWSQVYRFATNQGYFFLKKVPPALALEMQIIKVLHNDFLANVPYILAENRKLNCFLMRDAGIPLHDQLQHQFYPELLLQATHDYSKLQIMTMTRNELFLELGVPDWRLVKLPTLYQDLISQENMLLSDGITNDEIFLLQKLKSKLIKHCEHLSSYTIKETFSHADFHAKNILLDKQTHQTTLIDLGEVAITHPFFSLLNCLHRAYATYSLTESQYQQLKIDAFTPWLSLETQERLLQIMDIVEKCWSIHAVLAEFRLINCVNESAFNQLGRQGRLANYLRHWMK